VQPATGDVVYDQCVDGVFRTELETRLAHLPVAELLRPPALSRATERFLAHWAGRSADAGGDGVRIERLKREPVEYGKALAAVNEFLGQHRRGSGGGGGCGSDGPTAAETDALLADVTRLPRGVTCALAGLLAYLREFGLEHVLRLTRYFAPFASRRTLALNAATLRNLELLQNGTDGQVYGSLLWRLDHTRTPMGKRLLRRWVAQPLRLYEDVAARLDAVAELAQGARANDRGRPTLAARLQALLPGLPDLERLLIRVHYGKVCCLPPICRWT
jgi:DNA mismatch repair protein MSH3